MTSPNGIHHIAICTADIRRQLAFFSDVLGMKLIALFWMHGTEGARHAFMRLNESCSVSFVQTSEVAGIEREIGKTHSGHAGLPSAGGTLQHLAFNVPDREALLALRDRIRSRGIHVFGPMDHGMCHSIYFAGPEDLTLEISTNGVRIDPQARIDPDVVELAGISEGELARFRDPAPFTPPASPVPQPPIDPDQPRMRGYPDKLYARMVATPDEVMAEAMRQSEPPVPPKED